MESECECQSAGRGWSARRSTMNPDVINRWLEIVIRQKVGFRLKGLDMGNAPPRCWRRCEPGSFGAVEGVTPWASETPTPPAWCAPASNDLAADKRSDELRRDHDGEDDQQDQAHLIPIQVVQRAVQGHANATGTHQPEDGAAPAAFKASMGPMRASSKASTSSLPTKPMERKPMASTPAMAPGCESPPASLGRARSCAQKCQMPWPHRRNHPGSHR